MKVGIEQWAEKRKKARKFRAAKEDKRPPKFKKDRELHNKYLDRYQRRVSKQLREYAPLLYLNKADEVSDNEEGKEHTYLQNLSTLDNINHTRRIQFEKIKRKFGLDLWEKP